MTHDLGPTARALLDAAREGLAPDAATLARVRAKVAATSTVAATGSALAIKLALVGVAAVIATGVALRAPVTRPVAPPTIELSAAATDAVPAVRVVAHAREATPPPSRPAASPSRPRAVVTRAAPATIVPPPPSAARGIDLAREVQLVDDAMAALRRHDLGGALAAVRTHARETAGRGQLAEDAAAIEIEALCQLRDRGVAAKLAAFDARWPASAQRSRLTTSCP